MAMTLEEQVAFHNQLLLSIESNLGKVTDDLAATNAALREVAEGQAVLIEIVKDMASRHNQLAERHEHLEQLFEQWLRAQRGGNGQG